MSAVASADSNNYPTEPGWYCIVFEVWGGTRCIGPIYQFEDGAWFDESGEQVESLYDPVLGVHVAMNGADDYVRKDFRK